MKPLYFILITGVLLTSCNTKQPAKDTKHILKEHSLSEDLRPFYDIASLPEYLDSTFCAQVSSYDITGNNDNGVSGTYSFADFIGFPYRWNRFILLAGPYH